jgi:hypothetical protein
MFKIMRDATCLLSIIGGTYEPSGEALEHSLALPFDEVNKELLV